MKTKTLLLAALALALAITGVIKTASKNPQPPETNIPPTRGQLLWYAAQAKAQGEKQVVVPAPSSDFSGSSGSTTIDKALTFSGAVIAQPTKEKIYTTDSSNEIATWYKFKVIDVLSRPKPPVCPDCHFLDPPPDFLPVGDDEFLVSKYGGTLMIDGVKVSMSEGEWPAFQHGRKYLLLLSIYPSGVAEVIGGPRGVFTVSEQGSLEPVSDQYHPIVKGMKERYGNSLDELKEHLKTR
jgi:hypothetical protein